MSIIKLFSVLPDKTPDYKYSGGLFDWFYGRVIFYSLRTGEYSQLLVDTERTRKDNSSGGCRIYLEDGTYIKFQEASLMMEFTEEQCNKIEGEAKRNGYTKYITMFGYVFTYIK